MRRQFKFEPPPCFRTALIELALPDRISALYNLFSPLIVRGIQLEHFEAVDPAVRGDDRFVIDMQRDLIEARKFGGHRVRMTALHLIFMSLPIDDSVKADTVMPKKTSDIPNAPVGGRVHPDLITHGAQLRDQFCRAEAEALFVDPVQWKP